MISHHHSHPRFRKSSMHNSHHYHHRFPRDKTYQDPAPPPQLLLQAANQRQIIQPKRNIHQIARQRSLRLKHILPPQKIADLYTMNYTCKRQLNCSKTKRYAPQHQRLQALHAHRQQAKDLCIMSYNIKKIVHLIKRRRRNL